MIVGIDLGTTNSLIGAYLEDGPRLFPNPQGGLLTPSAISIDDAGGVIVGQGARDRLTTHPDRSVAGFKRWMGSTRETVLGGRSLRPEQLSALVLRSLIADAEAATGQTVTEAVISVPAYFSDAQRTATRVAGELSGIRVERLINEPTAAALAYGLQERADGGHFLVFDLGGGTLDVSIIEIFEGVVEVHASAGDNYLGGEDFLDIIVRAALADLRLDPDSLSPSELAQLRRRLELAKINLSRAPGATLDITLAGQDRTWSLDEARFEELAAPLIQRLRAPLERTLRDANLVPGKLDEVVLVGGASRMPLVARTVSRLLGRLPLRHINADQAIALGASIAGGMKARNAKLEEVILTDVCPYTLGTDVVKRDASGGYHTGYLLPIIERNSAVPVSREHEIWPVTDDQTHLEFNIFQGENPVAEKNVKLGSLTVQLPPGKDRTERGAIIRFTYDINGILQVDVKIKATGEMHSLVLEQNAGVLSKDEIQQRLAALAYLKIHPRDDQENLALIARAERLYEEQLSDREKLQDMMLDFKGILESQDARLIARTRKQFSDALTAVERA
jgi:molecular chaperone HscC